MIPVPLHPEKLQGRGYNQSEKIAEGIASIAHFPLKTDYIDFKKLRRSIKVNNYDYDDGFVNQTSLSIIDEKSL